MKYILTFSIGMLLGMSFLALNGCSTVPHHVGYVNTSDARVSSSNMNPAVLQMATDDLIDNMLSSPGVQQLTHQNTQKPTLYFAGVVNNSTSFLNADLISNTLSTRLLESDRFSYIDISALNASETQKALQNSSGVMSQEIAVKLGHQVNAHYVLFGSVTNAISPNPNQPAEDFLLTLQLLNAENGHLIWQGVQSLGTAAKKPLWHPWF